jgi:hypothetical protein
VIEIPSTAFMPAVIDNNKDLEIHCKIKLRQNLNKNEIGTKKMCFAEFAGGDRGVLAMTAMLKLSRGFAR